MMFFLTCIYLLVFYVQPGGRYPVLGTVRIELLLGAVILVLLFIFRSKNILSARRMNRGIIVFLAAICLSFFGALQTHTATDAFEVFVKLLKFASIYVMIVGTVDSKQRLEKLLWVYVFCMVILVGEPFLLSLQGENLVAKEDGVIRLYGIGQFAHPNGLGTIAVTTLILLYYLFWHYRSLVVRASLLVSSIVCLRVIMLTASRTAYVGLLLTLSIIFVYSRRKLHFLVAAFMLSAILLTYVPEMYKDRFFSLREVSTAISSDERQRGAIGGRWALIQDAWDVFLDYPIFGCGIDSFRRIGFEQKEFDTFAQTHNLLMQILAETGLVGLAAFTFLAFTVWKTLKATELKLIDLGRTEDLTYQLTIALKVFFLTTLSLGMLAQHNLYSNVWWIIAGLGLVCSRLADEQEQERTQEQPDALIGKLETSSVR